VTRRGARASSLIAIVAAALCACSSSPLDPGANQGEDANSGGAADRVARAMAAASCFDIEDIYGQALAAAQRCDPDRTDQCLVSVRLSLPCGCTTTVNDATESNAVAEVWTKRGCARNMETCPAECIVSTSPNPCVAVAAGGGMCVPRGP
jgi:hypothetical protein